jgi:hypothetical protein
MKTEGSLPHSQVPANYPQPATNQSSPCLPILFLEEQFEYYPPSTSRYSKWSLSLRFPQRKLVYISPVSRTCHMPDLSHYPWFGHMNKIR